MDGLPPSTPLPAAAVHAAACSPELSGVQAGQLLEQARRAFPRTTFEAAWPSCLPGFVALRLSNQTVAYMDKSGRYLMFGLVLDSATGTALDRQLDGRPE